MDRCRIRTRRGWGCVGGSRLQDRSSGSSISGSRGRETCDESDLVASLKDVAGARGCSEASRLGISIHVKINAAAISSANVKGKERLGVQL